MKSFIFILALLLTAVATAMPVITERTDFYKIKGTTASELRAQMNALGPLDKTRRFDAKTNWYITWRYNWRYDSPSQNPCYVTTVQVSGDISYIFPEWINQNQANPALQIKWKTYFSNLTTHEQGHANNGKQTAAEIEKALLNVQPQVNCTVLDNTLDAAAKKVLAQHNAWDIQYDADTDHGKKQGAVFP